MLSSETPVSQMRESAAATTTPFDVTQQPMRGLSGRILEADRPPKRQAAALADGPPSALQPASLGLDERLVRDFVATVVAPDDRPVREFIGRLREAGISPESIFLDLLAPAARMLGAQWEEDVCGFAEVTIALGRMQLVLRDLSRLFVRDRLEADLVGRVLLAGVPGEQHSLGLFMVAEFFIRDGWGVQVGPGERESALLADIGATHYDIIGFSTSCDSRLDHLKRLIQRVRASSRNRNVVIMVGGRAFNEQPELVDRVGADASALNAELAPERARQLLRFA